MQSWSYWEKDGYLNSDVVIVGAGIVGLFTAYYLSKKYPTKKITVLDRHSLAAGASTKNAGFACFGSVTEIADDLLSMDRQELLALINMRWEGLQRMRSVISDNDLDYQTAGAYEVFDDEAQFQKYTNKLDEYNALVKDACGLEQCFSVKKPKLGGKLYGEMIYNQYEGQLNPYKLISTLRKHLMANDVRFIQGLELKHWESNDGIKLTLSNGETIQTEKLVLATNAFTKKFFPKIELTPYRNQVLVTEPIHNLSYKGCFHYNKGYTYFRNIGNRLLIGGFRNLAMEEEQTTSFGLTNTIQNALESFIADRLDLDIRVDHRWSGILASGPKKSALLREVEENVFLGVRLGGMGVAIGSEVAHRLSLMVY